MGATKVGGNPVKLSGEFPRVKDIVKEMHAVKSDLSPISLDDFKGKRKILNIFPSIDTDICATSVRKFNQKASEIDNTAVICLSFDLPFAHKRFCGAEGIEKVITASLFRNRGTAVELGVLMEDGPIAGLCARAVIVLDEDNTVIHSQLMEDIKIEPDYDAAVAVLQ